MNWRFLLALVFVISACSELPEDEAILDDMLIEILDVSSGGLKIRHASPQYSEPARSQLKARVYEKAQLICGAHNKEAVLVGSNTRLTPGFGASSTDTYVCKS